MVEKIEKKKKELDEYEILNCKLASWYKCWILANEQESLNTRRPEYVFMALKHVKDL